MRTQTSVFENRAAAGVAGLAALLVVSAAVALQAAGVAAAATDPKMRFDGRMQVDDVCFTVTNPALGQSMLYGRRYVDGPVSP